MAARSTRPVPRPSLSSRAAMASAGARAVAPPDRTMEYAFIRADLHRVVLLSLLMLAIVVGLSFVLS